eukprot:TRINITY_DN1459_c0_g1_i9.p1 TRINITY_DN1459_c0_g1~~TRINITY_DN1459_c0_g1_i9.p1  ORF type:complete len:803 (-),score=187.75 TRINITY_DN1459_c0_g1_i9:417-2825(-)
MCIRDRYQRRVREFARTAMPKGAPSKKRKNEPSRLTSCSGFLTNANHKAEQHEPEAGEHDQQYFEENMQFASFLSSVNLSDLKPTAKQTKKQQRKEEEKPDWTAVAAKKVREDAARSVASAIATKDFTSLEERKGKAAESLEYIPEEAICGRKRPGKRAEEKMETLNKPEPYETAARSSWKNRKHDEERDLLPLKGEDGSLIKQKPVVVPTRAADEAQEAEEEPVEEGDEGTEIEKRKSKKGAIMAALGELGDYARIHQAKILLAEAAELILSEPEEHLKMLQDVLEVCSDFDGTVKQYAFATLCAVIVDIIPGYSVKDKSQREDPQRGLSKEVAERDMYEQGLLQCYTKYIQCLKSCAKGRSTVSQKAIKCLCILLEKTQHFNNWATLVKVLVPRMCSVHDAVRSPVCEAVRAVFKADYAGDRSILIVRELARIAKAQPSALRPEMVATILALPLNTKMIDTDLEQYEKKQEDRKRKRTKKNKRAQIAAERELQRDLKHTAAEADATQKRKTQTETLRNVFTLYFRILKNSPEGDVLPAVLAGVAKYAHLISIEFINDLMVCLEACMVDTNIGVAGRLSACLSVLRFVQTQGAVFNTDLKDVHTHLFGLMRDIGSMLHSTPLTRDDDDDEDDVSTGIPTDVKDAQVSAIDSLQLLLFNRAQMTESRAAGFIKLLFAEANQCTDSGLGLSMIAVAAGLLERFSRTTQMLESDSSALGSYRADVDDPEYCNALASKVWELELLTHHFHPLVAAKANSILNRTKDSLALDTPMELLSKYSTHGSFDLNPPMEPPSKRGGAEGNS